MIFSGFYVDFLNHILVNVITTLVLINVDDFPFLAKFEERIVHFLVWFDVECLIILHMPSKGHDSHEISRLAIWITVCFGTKTLLPHLLNQDTNKAKRDSYGQKVLRCNFCNSTIIRISSFLAMTVCV